MLIRALTTSKEICRRLEKDSFLNPLVIIDSIGSMTLTHRRLKSNPNSGSISVLHDSKKIMLKVVWQDQYYYTELPSKSRMESTVENLPCFFKDNAFAHSSQLTAKN